jgi:hypothetical protein
MSISTFVLWDDARQWRARAEGWRAAANVMNDEDCKERACRVADDYDRMAKYAEERTKLSGSRWWWVIAGVGEDAE